MIVDKGKYIEHIRDEEQILTMRKVLDKVEKVVDFHTEEHTDFLDPYQRKLCHSFLNKFIDISYHEEGGYIEAERKSIIIYPSYKSQYDISNYVAAIRINGNFKFSNLSHRDYLGAILSLGIKREKIGDILIHEDFGQIVLNREILDYISYNFNSIGRESIEVEEIDLRDIVRGKEHYDEIVSTVPSLRLDAILSAGYNMSRTKSSSFIKSSKIKVNWQPISQSSHEVSEDDLISAKGFGRMRVHRVEGKSRKGRIRIVIRIIK